MDMDDVLGHGSEGIVYKAKWHLTTDVAIKILCPDLPVEEWSEEMLENWLNEIKIHDNCNHRNIVTFRGISIDQKSRIMLISDYMKDGNLSRYIRYWLVSY